MTIKTKIFYIWLVIASVFVLWRILTNPITLGFLGKLKRGEVLVREQDEVLVLPEEENNAPRFSSRPLLTAVVDQAYIYEVKAVDPDGDMLTYQLEEGPGGMKISPSSGTISWTPPLGVVGPQEVKVVVKDDGGETDTQSWTIEVKAEATGFVTGRVYSDQYLPEGETLSVKAVVTADNHYGLYYGSPGRLHFVGRNEIGSSGNPGTYNWSEAETFLFDLKPDDYLYVVAWNNGYAKMWLGEFQLFNHIYLRSNNKDWVSTMARGDKPPVDEVHVPSQKVLESEIRNPNWSSKQESIPNKNHFRWGQVPQISDLAEFTWHDSFLSNNNDYVIFRSKVPVGSHIASFYPVGLDGQVVYLDENENGRRDSNELYTLTDADGYYSLSRPEGTYTLGLEIPPGWVQLSGANSTYKVIITNNETVYLDFPLTKGSTEN